MESTKTGYPSIDKPWLKYYSQDLESKIVPNMSMYQMAEYYNKNRLNNVALEIRTSQNDFKKGKAFTYKEYLEEMKKFAKALSLLGVKENEIISTILPNIPESRISIYGSNIIGATPYAITPLLAPEKYNKIIEENNLKRVYVLKHVKRNEYVKMHKTDFFFHAEELVRFVEKYPQFKGVLKEELLNKDIINYESITGMSLLEIFNKEGKYFEDKIYNK